LSRFAETDFEPNLKSDFGSLISCPVAFWGRPATRKPAVIQSQITGQAEIAGGGRTLAQDQHIAVLLRSGPLPVPLTVVSTQPIQ
jgi:preprotein translocase subunit SecD